MSTFSLRASSACLPVDDDDENSPKRSSEELEDERSPPTARPKRLRAMQVKDLSLPNNNSQGISAFAATLSGMGVNFSPSLDDLVKYSFHAARVLDAMESGRKCPKEEDPWCYLYSLTWAIAWAQYCPSVHGVDKSPSADFRHSPVLRESDRTDVAVITRHLWLHAAPWGGSDGILMTPATPAYAELNTKLRQIKGPYAYPTGDLFTTAPLLENYTKAVEVTMADLNWDALVTLNPEEVYQHRYERLPKAFFTPSDKVADDTQYVVWSMQDLVERGYPADLQRLAEIAGAALTEINDYRRLFEKALICHEVADDTSAEAVLIARAVGLTLGPAVARRMVAKVYCGFSRFAPLKLPQTKQLIRSIYGQCWFPSAFMNLEPDAATLQCVVGLGFEWIV